MNKSFDKLELGDVVMYSDAVYVVSEFKVTTIHKHKFVVFIGAIVEYNEWGHRRGYIKDKKIFYAHEKKTFSVIGNIGVVKKK
jgi:hypothetical protein